MKDLFGICQDSTLARWKFPLLHKFSGLYAIIYKQCGIADYIHTEQTFCKAKALFSP